jgi:hypothetical protein
LCGKLEIVAVQPLDLSTRRFGRAAIVDYIVRRFEPGGSIGLGTQHRECFRAGDRVALHEPFEL